MLGRTISAGRALAAASQDAGNAFLFFYSKVGVHGVRIPFFAASAIPVGLQARPTLALDPVSSSHAHFTSAARSLHEPQPDAGAPQPTLTWRQAQRVSRIIQQRQDRELQQIRAQEAKNRQPDDIPLPLHSWAAVVESGRQALPAEEVHLPGRVFGRVYKNQVIQQVIRWQLAKRRKGLASSKTRSEVSGGGRKPWQQKGGGRARQGSIRAPQWRGGGINFGPKPRSFAFKLTKKREASMLALREVFVLTLCKVPVQTRRAGIMYALSAKAAQNEIIVVDRVALSSAEAEAAYARLVADNADIFADLESYSMPRFMNHRERVLSVYDTLSAQARDAGVEDPETEAFAAGARAVAEVAARRAERAGGIKGSELAALGEEEAAARRDFASAVTRMMAKYRTDFATELARAGWFESRFQHLLPENWSDLPESMARSNLLLRQLNTGFDPDRLARQERKRCPDLKMSALIIDTSKEGEDGGALLRRSISNLPGVNALPVAGANVYDIIRHKHVIITRPALDALVDRLTRPINRGFKPKGYDWRVWAAEVAARRERQDELRARFPEWLAQRQAAVRRLRAAEGTTA